MTTQEILEAARAARSALGLSSGEVRRAALLGMAEALCSPARQQAILEAPAGAVIVLAGKGNDAIQRVRGGYVHYDSDPVVAKRALALREKKQ